MTATISLTEDDLFAALGAFIEDVVGAPPWEVIQGQVNRAPSPSGADYIVMWPTMQRRLGTNTVTPAESGDIPGQLDLNHYRQPTEQSVQIDVHGPNSAKAATMITTLFRSPYACDFLAAYNGGAIQPLHADDPQQMAFENGEKQVENRWVIQAVLQANPVTTTVQQFADAVTVGLIEVDATYPPGA